jgi:predicted RNase H-like HicB family nuclease
VLQEVWDLCHNDLSEDGEDCTATTKTEEQVFMLLSSAVASGVLAHHTLQLLG